MKAYQFEVGEVYKAVAIDPNVNGRHVVCIGRQGGSVCFGFCDRFEVASGMWEHDRERVQIRDEHGNEFAISAAGKMEDEALEKGANDEEE